jgi:threonine synthase
MPSTLTHLECSRPTCRSTFDHAQRQHLCAKCQAPLLARYDLDAARRTLTRVALTGRVHSMWRYEEVLPDATPVTLGEGMTPLLHAQRLGAQLGLERLFIKEEGQNPTNSFKARGLSAAVTVAKALRVQ